MGMERKVLYASEASSSVSDGEGKNHAGKNFVETHSRSLMDKYSIKQLEVFQKDYFFLCNGSNEGYGMSKICNGRFLRHRKQREPSKACRLPSIAIRGRKISNVHGNSELC